MLILFEGSRGSSHPLVSNYYQCLVPAPLPGGLALQPCNQASNIKWDGAWGRGLWGWGRGGVNLWNLPARGEQVREWWRDSRRAGRGLQEWQKRLQGDEKEGQGQAKREWRGEGDGRWSGGGGRARKRKETGEMRRVGEKDGDDAWTGNGARWAGKGGGGERQQKQPSLRPHGHHPRPLLCPRPAVPPPTARGLPQSRVEPARGDAAPRGLCPTGQLHPVPGRPREPAKVETHRPVSQLWDWWREGRPSIPPPRRSNWGHGRLLAARSPPGGRDRDKWEQLGRAATRHICPAPGAAARAPCN